MSSYRFIYYCLIIINIRLHNRLMVVLTSWYHQTICMHIDWLSLSNAHKRHEVISIFYRKYIDKEEEEKKKKSNSISSSHACIHDSSIQLAIVKKNEKRRRKDLVIVNKIDRQLLFFFVLLLCQLMYSILSLSDTYSIWSKENLSM